MDRKSLKNIILTGVTGLLATVVQAGVILDDPLNGSTIGTRSGGSFTGGGWKVTNTNDYILWHIPTLGNGAAEFDVSGINPNECRPDHEDKSELFHMYDFNYGNADNVYNGGYRDSPHKHFVRKTNCLDQPRVNSCELLWQDWPDYTEPDSPQLSWSAAATYRIRLEWGPVGGSSQCKFFRDGILFNTMSAVGTWNPSGHSVRIAASPRAPIYGDFGAPLDAIFKNFKVFDQANSVPSAPTVVSPANGATINQQVPYIQWSGDSHSLYQVRVNTQNNPDGGIAADSQQISSSKDFSYMTSLGNNTTYYVFVRLGNSNGWSPWSAGGRTFVVNTSFVPGGANTTSVQGDAIKTNAGPVIRGLGASYMTALRRCKYDRTRMNSDLAFLASKEFNYVRTLSMVGWYSAWLGKEIAPVTFVAHDGYTVQAWSDYWQQFNDHIDIIYSYGMRTELTIFADAQLMPNKSTRITHMQNVLNNLAGREHKIMHLEVCNEAWQNGFPSPTGVFDLREFCQYLTDRTAIPVGISATPWGDYPDPQTSLIEMYAGSTADIATEHFSRDMGIEGGWYPVRDCWRCEDASGVPPCSSNEPIGPGSSVDQDTDPIRLVMAAAFAWGASLPLYVYHTSAGVFGDTTFESMAAVGSYVNLDSILPGEFSGWVRSDGKESSAPFTSYSNGQANKWWTEVGGATSGVVRNTAKIKGNQFISLPIGILSGGIELESRRPMTFTTYNPLTGAVVSTLTKNPGDRFTLAQGPRAYIIKGTFNDVPGGGGGSGTEVTIDLGNPSVENGMTHPQGGDGDTQPETIGGRSARRNVNTAEDYYFYFSVADSYTFNGDRPEQYITVDYYDSGTGTLQLQYDGTAGAFVVGPSITLTNTNTWKTSQLSITDAYFGNRQNNGADFRIFLGTGVVRRLDVVKVSVQPSQAGQGPFGGTARAIPGTIQAEDFDIGGQGVAYSDTDVPNNGGQYRTGERVDIETTTDTGGGYNVGFINNGEYLEYTVNVATTGDYAVKARVACATSGGSFHLAMNGTNITATKNLAPTGGWQTWTTIIIPGLFLAAGNNQVLRFEIDTGGFNFNNIIFTYGGDDVISYDLDNTSVEDGMGHPQPADGDTVGATIGGHFCRSNANPAEDFYMYFSVADQYTFNGNFPVAKVTIDYYDNGTGSHQLQYDGLSSSYTVGPSVTKTNTNTWKEFTFNVSDAYFGNRQNNGADFRISGSGTFYLDTVMVHTAEITQGPFGGTARTIPGTIQAEDYDTGGQNVAYNDTTAGNFMGGYRADSVDIETCGDTGGGFNIGFLAPGEWLEYTVNITNTGDHTIKVRMASGAAGGTYNFALNGVVITPNKTIPSTGGWQTYTTFHVPAVYMSAGNGQILRFNMLTDGMNINKFDFSFGGADAIHVDLDSTVYEDGMTHIQNGDGNTTGASIGGHNCRRNVSNTVDRYMYFGIFDIYAFQGNRPNVWITAEYYDAGTPTLTLTYDSTSSAYTNATGNPVLTNTNTWKTKSWNVTNGYFGNRQNAGADFRLNMSGSAAWYIDTVQTSLSQP